MIGVLPVTKEFRVLVATFGLGDGSSSRSECQTLLSDSGLEWNEVKGLLSRHRLLLAFCSELKRFELWQLLPDHVQRSLGELSRGVQLRQLTLVGELVSIGRAFDSSGIEYLSLKGPVLGQILYKDPTIRHSNDLDFLVKPSDLELAVQALGGLGYVAEEDLSYRGRFISESAQRHLYHLHLRKGNTHLELHWRVSRNENLMGASLDECFRNKQMVSVGGSEIPAFGKDDLLRYLALHGASHCWNRLKWLLDLKLILSTCDRAKSDTRAVQLGVDLCERLWVLGGPSQAKPGDLSQLCLQQLTSRSEPPDGVRNMLRRSWLLFRLHKGAGAKLCYSWSLLVWPPVFRLIKLPNSLAFAYPIVGGVAWILNKLRLIKLQ